MTKSTKGREGRTAGPWGVTPGADYDRDAWMVGPNHPKPTGAESHDDLVAITYKEEDARLIAAAPDLLAALEHAAKFIEETEHRFPKSIRNRDTFALNLCRAEIGKAIFRATGGEGK